MLLFFYNYLKSKHNVVLWNVLCVFVEKIFKVLFNNQPSKEQ